MYVDYELSLGQCQYGGVIGYIQSVTSGGDIILSIDGHPAKRLDDLDAYVTENKSVGDRLTLSIIRNEI